jgi:two-component system, cell cycle sensor histidine kinase PleC
MSLKPADASSEPGHAPDEWAALDRSAVLIVDDEPQLVTAMTDALDEQYRVVGQTSPQNALDILKEDPDIQVIISDQRMPAMTGDEFLFRAQEISPATRILVTAYADLGAVIKAVNQGKIFSFIRKPWDEDELRRAVESAAEHFTLGVALRRERALLKCIMDCSLDAISVKDTCHRYIRLNAAEAGMLGARSAEAANGRAHSDFLPAPRAALWSDEEHRVLETLEALRDRIEHVVSEDGVERWYATTKAPINPSSGAPIGLVSVTRDVTESKSIERIKDDFISTARHELRTPLTIIAGTIRLIRTGRLGALTPKVEELLTQSEANCDRLLRLVNNMLDIQDIMVGRAQLQLAPVALRELIEESCALSEATAKANAIDIQIGAIPSDAAVIGDRQRLTQVLCNLLSNACRFSPKGTAVTITVSQEADQVRLSVTDQGPGVPPAFADKLFKSFSQFESSAGRSHEGAGLGLCVCKAIAEAHGGRMSFKPAPGGGSDFFLVLPREGISRSKSTAWS